MPPERHAHTEETGLGRPEMTDVDPTLRALLVCPSCRGELEDAERGLICRAEGLVFPVEDGVPILVRELARRVREHTPAAAKSTE